MPVELQDDESVAHLLGLYDTPAFVRRGLQLAAARECLWQRCRGVRTDLLRGVRLHLRGILGAITSWADLQPFLTPTELAAIAELAEQLDLEAPRALHAVPRRRLPRRLEELAHSIMRFNARWQRALELMDIDDVNRQIADYNHKYPLEKECALRSAQLAARGFCPEPLLRREELAARFPLLVVPGLREAAR
jgi:hypothetical protein